MSHLSRYTMQTTIGCQVAWCDMKQQRINFVPKSQEILLIVKIKRILPLIFLVKEHKIFSELYNAIILSTLSMHIHSIQNNIIIL